MTDPAAPLTITQAIAELIHTLNQYAGMLMFASIPTVYAYFRWMKSRFDEAAEQRQATDKAIAEGVKKVEAIGVQAEHAANVAVEVKRDLGVHTQKNDVVQAAMAEGIKEAVDLANGATEANLETIALTTQALADKEPTPVNIAIADSARKRYEEHKVKLDAINAAKLLP